MVKDPDTILSQGVIDRESLAVAMLEQYYASLHFLAYSILSDPDLADDAVQEAIIRALDRIESYQVGSNMHAWLSAIVVNQCRDMLRRMKTRQRVQDVLQRFKINRTPQHSTEDRLLSNEAKQDLWSAVNTLNDKHRLPIILRYVHNYNAREIAQILGTREGTIHSRLHYACRQLQRQLMITDDEALIKEYLYE